MLKVSNLQTSAANLNSSAEIGLDAFLLNLLYVNPLKLKYQELADCTIMLSSCFSYLSLTICWNVCFRITKIPCKGGCFSILVLSFGFKFLSMYI